MKKTDPRVVRTRRFLRDALMELVAEKGYENVMIQDIAERATLNRATFYLHYKDKEELLYDCSKEIFEDLWIRGKGPEGVVALMIDPTSADATMFIPIFEHFAEHANFYRVVLGEKGVPAFAGIAHRYSSEAMREQLRNHMKDADPILMDILLNFIAAGVLGIISWWLKNNMSHSPEVMSRYLAAIVSQSMLHFTQQPG